MPKFVTPPPTATGSIVNLDLVFNIFLSKNGVTIYFYSQVDGTYIEWVFDSKEDAKEFYDGFCNLQASKIVVKVN